MSIHQLLGCDLILSQARREISHNLSTLMVLVQKEKRYRISYHTKIRLRKFFKTHYRHKGDVAIIYSDGTIAIPGEGSHASTLFNTLVKEIVLDNVNEELHEQKETTNDEVQKDILLGEFQQSIIDNLMLSMSGTPESLYANLNPELRHKLIDAYEKTPYPIGAKCALTQAPDAFVWKIVGGTKTRLIIEHNLLNVQRTVHKNDIIVSRKNSSQKSIANTQVSKRILFRQGIK